MFSGLCSDTCALRLLVGLFICVLFLLFSLGFRVRVCLLIVAQMFFVLIVLVVLLFCVWLFVC